MSLGSTRMHLVWTRHGRRFYALATDGTEAIDKVNRHLTLRAQERNIKEPGDRAMSAFDWTDQDVVPAGRCVARGRSGAD